jgi:hypothetical protein
MEYPDAKHLENHKKVHGRKRKITEYGDPEFSKDRLRG